jgi:agmatinase
MAWEKPYGMDFDPFDKLAVIDYGDCFFDFGRPQSVPDVIEAHATLIHFDAHSDTWSDEVDRIDHGTMFFHAAKEGLVDPGSSAQVGLRTTNPDTMGFNVLDAPWVHENGIDAVVAKIRAVVGNKPAYLTFDIDCLDPSYAPGTGTPVCGGLTSHQAIEILRGLVGINLVGMDMVEVAPAYDVGEITALAAAALAMEMLYLYASRSAK